MLGYDAPYVPGWDCHGLPIEWKVEEQWRRDKKDKSLDPAGFRADCRAYAAKWVDVQKEQFKRLGVLADWDNQFGTYRTMQPEWESGILHTFHDMVRNGLVYRANKPVLWSPVERTALAEAETVEQEHTVPTIFLRFPVHSGSLFFEGANLLVWTTTPWSLPGNAAVAFNPDIAYGLYETPSGRYVVADALAETVFTESHRRLRDVPASDLDGHTLFHPLSTRRGNGYKAIEAIPSSFVRESAGTGLVHVGPAHSTEDWIAWRTAKGDAPFPNPVGENGVYNDDVRVFAGIAVTKGKKLGPANQAVIDHLAANGMLYRREDRPITMQHSWRSDAVLITRAAPQVFISLDTLAPTNGLVQGSTTARDRAMNELADVEFVPPHARQRMMSMLANRPDWLVSRQRLWGTPLALFVHKTTGAICDDPNVLAATHQTLADAGSEAWFDLTPATVFKYAQRDDADQWERLDDVLDVWFDSGCVHVMMNTTADLVVEGTDQSRGWFQSSLLVAVLSGKQAPFRKVLTHGFALDATGKKMSKSQGNVLDPQKVIDQYGADVLRVWVASTDVTEDVRASMGAMDTHAETARKIRNTMRYMVGALHDYDASSGSPDTPDNDAPELERYIRHRMFVTNETLAGMLRANNLTQYMSTIVNFCVHDLSSLLFDIRKDVLYCDARSSSKRRAYRYLLRQLFHHMVIWIAPVMPFAAEELFQANYPAPSIIVDGEEFKNPRHSVHLQRWLSTVETYRDEALADKWERLIGYRSKMLAEIEAQRAAGVIKASTEVAMVVIAKTGSQAYDDLSTMTRDELSDFGIVGDAMLMGIDLFPEEWGEIKVDVEKSESEKCDRCWLSKVDVHECNTGKLCDRCCEVV
jgi:isoleucyl-tRNA synthetase